MLSGYLFFLYIEIDHTRLPFVADFHADRRNEAKLRGLIREDADKPCSGFDRAIETFFEIVGPEFLAHRFWQREDRQAFRNILLQWISASLNA